MLPDDISDEVKAEREKLLRDRAAVYLEHKRRAAERQRRYRQSAKGLETELRKRKARQERLAACREAADQIRRQQLLDTRIAEMRAIDDGIRAAKMAAVLAEIRQVERELACDDGTP